jgi:hypothetical protein
LESQVLKVFPYSVECKFQEAWAIPTRIKQAKSNQMKETDWLLVCKKSNEEPVVVMDATTFFSLLGGNKT